MTIEEFLKRISDIGNKADSFWEHISQLESVEFEDSIKGKIEENVVIKGKVHLGKNSIIKSGTYIDGNAFIGDNCSIGPFAYLRKNVIIKDFSNIGRSEIKNSIILSNTNIMHVSYIGDSIIGENCNIGAGTNIANLRFDNKNIKVNVDGKKIDSGRRKLGAFLGRGTKTGINSSINCGIIIGENCFIYPSALVKRNLKAGEVFK